MVNLLHFNAWQICGSQNGYEALKFRLVCILILVSFIDKSFDSQTLSMQLHSLINDIEISVTMK